jgi:hypothetical protein
MVLLGNAIGPGIADRYLARTGYDSQQTDEPVAADRPDNLFAPVPGDHGGHGDFDAQAHDGSLQWLLTRHRRLLGAAGAGAGLAALIGVGRRGARPRRR